MMLIFECAFYFGLGIEFIWIQEVTIWTWMIFHTLAISLKKENQIFGKEHTVSVLYIFKKTYILHELMIKQLIIEENDY